MNRQSRSTVTLSKSALETKAQIEKAAETHCTGRNKEIKKEPLGICSGKRKDVPVLQKQALHSYMCSCHSTEKKIQRTKKRSIRDYNHDRGNEKKPNRRVRRQSDDISERISKKKKMKNRGEKIRKLEDQ